MVWLTVHHDHAARAWVSEQAGRHLVALIGIGDVNGLVEGAARVAPVEHIVADRGALVALPELVSLRGIAEGDPIFTQLGALVPQLQCPL